MFSLPVRLVTIQYKKLANIGIMKCWMGPPVPLGKILRIEYPLSSNSLAHAMNTLHLIANSCLDSYALLKTY